MTLILLVLIIVIIVFYYKIKSLEDDVDSLKQNIQTILEKLGHPFPTKKITPPAESELARGPQQELIFKDLPPQEPKPAPLKKPAAPTITTHAQDSNFEKNFSMNYAVWAGAIAIALSGFFLVKYSIDAGLLNPPVRIILGMILGVCLIGSGLWVAKKPDFSNGIRISQALIGAGVADLYACIFAASTLYHLIPVELGLVVIAILTGMAVILSLHHGMPIALLGLVGGFLTPALLTNLHISTPLFFLYLYAVVASLLFVIRTKNWWMLSVPTLLAAFIWVGVWLFLGYRSPWDMHFLVLFLIAVNCTAIASFWRHEDRTHPDSIHNEYILAGSYLAFGGPALLMCAIQVYTGFGLMEWGLLAILSIAGIVLAYFDQKTYGFVPYITMIFCAMITILAKNTDMITYALLAFGVLYCAMGYLIQWRAQNPLRWALLITSTSLTYYLIAYFRLEYTADLIKTPYFFGILAFILASLCTFVLYKVLNRFHNEHPQKQYLLACYTATSTAFIAIAATIELPGDFLSVALAAEFCALAWINTKVHINAMRTIAEAVAIVAGLILVPQLLAVGVWWLGTSFPAPFRDIAIRPIFQLGLPSLFFAGGAYFLEQKGSDYLVKLIESFVLLLLTVMTYFIIRHLFHTDLSFIYTKTSFIERSVITHSTFILGLISLWLGQRFSKEVLSRGGFVLIVCGIARILAFDFLLYHPFAAYQYVGTYPIFNALLLVYLLPIVWLWQIHALPIFKEWRNYLDGFILLLSLAWLTFSVRHLFHNPILIGGTMSHMEIISYSIAWLLFSIGLLFIGTLKKRKSVRTAGLVIMMLTIAKVFLYDASSLEGLLRVLSFLGLGLSLIGLSWFSSRFVFFDERDHNENERSE